MIITASSILPLTGPIPILRKSAVVISKDAITAIGPVDRVLKRHRGHRVLRLDNAVLMPGLVNVHTHLELPPLLGSLRALSLPQWVLNLIRVKKRLTDKEYLAAARQNIQEIIKTGTTCVGEICTHGISSPLLQASGLRSTVFQEIISMDPGAPIPAFPKLPARPAGLVRYGLSPHAPHTVSKTVLEGVRPVLVLISGWNGNDPTVDHAHNTGFGLPEQVGMKVAGSPTGQGDGDKIGFPAPFERANEVIHAERFRTSPCGHCDEVLRRNPVLAMERDRCAHLVPHTQARSAREAVRTEPNGDPRFQETFELHPSDAGLLIAAGTMGHAGTCPPKQRYIAIGSMHGMHGKKGRGKQTQSMQVFER